MQFVAVATSFQVYSLSSFSWSVVKYTTNSVAPMDSFPFFLFFVLVFFLYFRINSVCRFVALGECSITMDSHRALGDSSTSYVVSVVRSEGAF